MAHFIFSNEKFLKLLHEVDELSRKESAELFKKLGVATQEQTFVTMLVISRNEFLGFEILFDLAIECERVYKKAIDVVKMRIVVLPSLEAASKSPHLERANFVLIPDENLLGVENYPELETILPFL